jgi:uncharacterized DUF497 family protein
MEIRYYLLGKTDNYDPLFVVFTLRNTCIRVISARPMNKKEFETFLELSKKSNNEEI